MYKRHIFPICSVTLIATILMSTLTFVYHDPPIAKGGFKRQFISAPVVMRNSYTSENTITDVCGTSKGYYFFSSKMRGKLLILDSSLNFVQYLDCKLSENTKALSLLLTYVDSSNVYFMSGNAPAVIIYNMESKKIYHHQNRDQNYFTGVPISSNTFILKGYDSSTLTDQIFKKYNLLSDIVNYETNITKKKHDGGISDDGYLTYDANSSKLVYINYYYNRFICIDTNLHVLYQSKTIDTFNTSLVKATVTVLPSGLKSFSPDSPPKFINFQCGIYESQILVNSLVPSDNDDDTEFKRNSVFDIYDIRNGSYLHSFYVPALKGKKLNRFKIFGNALIAIYDNVIVTYEFVGASKKVV